MIACLLRRGDIDESGYMEKEVSFTDFVRLYASDIRMLQLAKSAIAAGISTLMNKAKTNASEIEHFFIAGGFGTYLNLKNASDIGLFPSDLLYKAKSVGNAALDGASIILLNASNRKKTTQIAQNAIVIELSADPVFQEEYINNMLF